MCATLPYMNIYVYVQPKENGKHEWFLLDVS